MMFRKFRLLFATHTGGGRRLMRRDQSEIPADVIPREVLDELRQRGYSVTQTNYSAAAFGNAMIVLERDTTDIQLVRDRSPWFVEVRSRRRTWRTSTWFGDARDWYSPEIWRAFLDGSTPRAEIVPFVEETGWLLENLDRIEASSGPTKKQLAAIYEARDGLEV